MADDAWKVCWDVREILQNRRNYAFPKTLAIDTGMTRAEVELGLWYWREAGSAGRRKDGRWFWKNAASAK